MSTQTELQKYIPSQDLKRDIRKTSFGIIEVDGEVFPHIETNDFPPMDPWSRHMRGVIAGLRKKDAFVDKGVTELGIGDGRNIREVGNGLTRVVGVDIEEWRVQTAAMNLVTGKYPLRHTVDLYVGDAVDFLHQQRDVVSGWVLMCLPQSPEGLNFADRYDGQVSLAPYRTDWEYAGLTLNAAALDGLRRVASSDLRALVIIADRVPDEIKASLFAKTGWVVEKQFRTLEPIQQDPDTGISWVGAIDDGRRFWQRANGGFEPITAFEAEHRRKESIESGLGREVLDVYHGLTVYQLSPK